MKRNYVKIAASSILISIVGVFIIDYFSHLLFSSPMETTEYFMAKASLYFVFSIIFLSVLDLKRNESIKVLFGGIVVASIWGTYYNILPILFNFYPFGIPLEGLTFWGMGILGTGIAFGIVHTVAFVAGYCSTKLIERLFASKQTPGKP